MARARAQIDQAGITAAFAADGLHGVSASDVARRAGVAKPTLYAHGRSKEALFAACVDTEVERLVARLHAADLRTLGRPLHQRAAALALALLDHAVDEPEAFRLLHATARHSRSSVAAAVDRALRRIPDRIDAALRRDLVAGGASPETLAAAARALHGAAAGVAAGEPLADRRAVAELLGRALAAGVRPAASEPAAPSTIELGVY